MLLADVDNIYKYLFGNIYELWNTLIAYTM